MGAFCGKGIKGEDPEKNEKGSKQTESEVVKVPASRGALVKQASKHTVKRLTKVRSRVTERTLDAFESFGSFSSNSLTEGKGKDRRVGILSFEVANMVMKAINLKLSLTREEMERFKKEVLTSEGIQRLVSSDMKELWRIAALDRRQDLLNLASEVVRLSKQVSDNPDLAGLEERLRRLGSDGGKGAILSPAELHENMEWIHEQVASTADLYHELHALDAARASLRRREEEEAMFPGSQKEIVVGMKQEVKQQERQVRILKRKCIWSKRLSHIVEMLSEFVVALHAQLVEAFVKEVPRAVLLTKAGPVKDPSRLGSSGLALHYANLITDIDNLAARPNAVSTTARDKLYHMLPFAVRKAARSRMKKLQPSDTETVVDIKHRMDSILDWLAPMAGNTIRWATDRRLQGHSDLFLLQTLHHANQGKTEGVILELVFDLHRAVMKAKNPILHTRERSLYSPADIPSISSIPMLPPLSSFKKDPPQKVPHSATPQEGKEVGAKTAPEKKHKKSKTKKRASGSSTRPKKETLKPLVPPQASLISPPPLDPALAPPPLPDLSPELLEKRLAELAAGRAAMGVSLEDQSDPKSLESISETRVHLELPERRHSRELYERMDSPSKGRKKLSPHSSQELGRVKSSMMRTLSPGNGSEVDIDRIQGKRSSA